MPFLAYFFLCIIAGLIGRPSNLGFWGFFFLSIPLTPIVGIAIAILGAPRSAPL